MICCGEVLRSALFLCIGLEDIAVGTDVTLLVIVIVTVLVSGCLWRGAGAWASFFLLSAAKSFWCLAMICTCPATNADRSSGGYGIRIAKGGVGGDEGWSVESEYLDKVFKSAIWDCREAAIENLDCKQTSEVVCSIGQILRFRYSVEIWPAPARRPWWSRWNSISENRTFLSWRFYSVQLFEDQVEIK